MAATAVVEPASCSSCGLTGERLIPHKDQIYCFDCCLREFKKERRLFLSGNELLSSEESKILWVVRGLIEADSTGQLFGPSGGGKSFLALDLVLSVATGQPWNGRETKRGQVLYLAGEGHTGMKRRIRAWWFEHGKPDLQAFHLSQHTVPFDEMAVKQIVQAGRDIEEIGAPVSVFVVDTLARHMTGDENSTRDMGAFLLTCETIRSQFPGSVLLIVHHTGNADDAKHRSRGSSALKAAMDFELHCDKGLLSVTKLKDGDPPEPIAFKLRPVAVGSDEDGNPITSCVVDYGERSQRHVMADLTPNEKLLLGLIRDNQGVLIGDLRQHFYTKRRESDPDAKHGTLKKAFSRSWEGISAKGFAGLDGNVVTVGQATNGGHCTMSPYEGDRATLGDTPTGWCPPVAVSRPPDLPQSDHLAVLDEFIEREVSP